MKLGKPFISLIVCVFNGEQTLRHCIDSISGQTYPAKELIVIDGGSSDGTKDILKNGGNAIAYWESKPDNGICHAWNKALTHASGDWIYFLGADDFLWDNDVLEHVSKTLAVAYPPCRVVYGKVFSVDSDNTVLETTGVSWDEAKRSFPKRMSIPHQGVFHHKTLFQSHGKFDESFRIAGDYELLLRELGKKDALFVDDVIVAGVRIGGISNRLNERSLFLKENIRARRKNNVSYIDPTLFLDVFRSFVRVLSAKLFGNRFSERLAASYHVYVKIIRHWRGTVS